MKTKGFIYAILSAIFFGSAGIFVKNGYEQNFSPVDLLMLQYIIAGIILLFYSIIRYREKMKLSKELLKKLLIQGAIFNTLMTVFFYSTFKYLDVAVTTILLYTYPVMVALYSFIFLKEKLSKIKVLSIIGTLAGCYLVLNINQISAGNNYTIGIIFGILSAIFYAAVNIYAKYIVEDVPEVLITFYTTLFSLIVLLIFNFEFVFKLSNVSFESVKNAALLAFFCEIIPLTLLYSAIKYIGPVTTSIISTIEIPSAAILSFVFMKEYIDSVQMIGIFLVVACVIMLKKEAS
ncbi:EamA-like transporter family protein [Caloramator mitchellensis]|uniref:EamA-like transporter family protein n=1 Tax=Caloramator mitchellensis TaxID=908809 RepID=A0A0R3JVQ0_CALMK|nr:DMT family transporter [Caloramator mitchellensis]KRQ86397.1 EamA-like transporter family protein [Caloramator mitchellensis]